MAGLLRRSKSTRDARPTKIPRDQLDFAFENEILRAQTPQQNSESTAPSLPRLTRRQSFSNTRSPPQMSGIMGRSPPKTSHSHKRGSIFMKRDHPAPSPFKFSMFPASSRPASKQSTISEQPPQQQPPASAGGLLAPEACIGMALGSPSEVQKPKVEKISVFPAVQDSHSTHSELSVFSLPPEPYGIEVKGPLVKEARKEVKQKSKHEDNVKGWKKLFGKSFFGKKSSSKHQHQEQNALKFPKAEESPHVMVLETQPAPHLVPKSEVPPEKVEAQVSPAPCINVDIPEVEMERYSVMFGTLLQPSDKSSLFARRRSKGPSGTEAPAQPQIYLTPLKRNATTGQVCRSPLSMLGDSLRQASRSPSSSPGRSPNRSSVGLSRSKSAASPPPSPRTNVKYIVGTLPEGSVSEPQLAGKESSLLEAAEIHPRPSSQISNISRISEEEDLASSIDTPRGSFDEGDDEWLTRPDDGEPQWEMVTRRTSNPIKDEDSGEESDEESDEEAETEDKEHSEETAKAEDLAMAAQISIARQISVSQRQLLLPVVPKSQRLVSRAALKGPLSPRLVEQPLIVIPQSQNVEYGNVQ